MTTTCPAARKANRKPLTTRTLRFAAATSTLTLTATVGNKVTENDYSLTRCGSDYGDGYRLTKHVGHPGDECDVYHVNLADEGHTCDCKGASRHGHCKHIDAVVKLIQLNLV